MGLQLMIILVINYFMNCVLNESLKVQGVELSGILQRGFRLHLTGNKHAGKPVVAAKRAEITKGAL